MFARKFSLTALAVACLSSAAYAQNAVVDVEVQMREAESRLEEAARRVAELSSRRLQTLPSSSWSTRIAGGPVLGISIGSTDDASGPVEGVEVLAVSPGGAAADAGLRTGDVIIAVNGESLSADTRGEANGRLLDFMAGIEEGDVIDVGYLRAGKTASVEVSPRSLPPQVFSFNAPSRAFRFGTNGVPPSTLSGNVTLFDLDGRGWGDMEMVKLTEDLGRYFGTAEGMLVVRAPGDAAYQLKDGDVILEIDGRKPTSVPHAIRILDSYQQGERLKMRIMREQRSETLEIEVPDRRHDRVRGALPNVAVPVRPVIMRQTVDDERI